MKKRVYISVINDLVTDQRVHRIASTIYHSGYDVTLIGRRFRHSVKVPLKGMKIRRFKLFFNTGPLFYASYNIRLFFFLLTRKTSFVLISNDLDTLPANYLVAKLRRAKLVYDSHEYFTQVPELIDRNFVTRFWSALERVFVPGVDAAYTVNESLAKMYSVRYGIEFGVIRNVPDTSLEEKDYPLPERFRKGGFLLYQGAVNRDRGLEGLIDILSDEQHLRLIIAGDGDVIDKLKETVQSGNCRDRIYFTGKIKPARLKSITRKAILGLSLEKKTNLNYYYALPNKLFDYIRAGIPVLCSDFPEMSKIINEHQVGKTVNSSDSDAVKKEINMMISDKKARETWIKNANMASGKLNWETEQIKLSEIYNKVGITIRIDS